MSHMCAYMNLLAQIGPTRAQKVILDKTLRGKESKMKVVTLVTFATENEGHGMNKHCTISDQTSNLQIVKSLSHVQHYKTLPDI